MRNITVSVDEETYRLSSRLAAEAGTSLGAFLGEVLNGFKDPDAAPLLKQAIRDSQRLRPAETAGEGVSVTRYLASLPVAERGARLESLIEIKDAGRNEYDRDWVDLTEDYGE